ncbi:hypothetical protein GQ55_1G180500 [Panicum hallii var. hallii]|uniref:Uncharacterized protein n=1 Tax=Panicum hallii var. hallii TaxID=1504633 RepID=A0A2T7F641_9POAL|nr:hypothetical protein GQ55_1G180500 [Panicum hallii var. hallii]
MSSSMRAQIWGGRALAIMEAAARGVRVQGEMGCCRSREGPPRVAGGARSPPSCAASGHLGRRCGQPRRRRTRLAASPARAAAGVPRRWRMRLAAGDPGAARLHGLQ